MNKTNAGNTETPLIMSVMAGSRKILSYLIKAEADVNVLSAMGETALVIAVGNGSVGCLKLCWMSLQISKIIWLQP